MARSPLPASPQRNHQSYSLAALVFFVLVVKRACAGPSRASNQRALAASGNRSNRRSARRAQSDSLRCPMPADVSFADGYNGSPPESPGRSDDQAGDDRRQTLPLYNSPPQQLSMKLAIARAGMINARNIAISPPLRGIISPHAELIADRVPIPASPINSSAYKPRSRFRPSSAAPQTR